MEILDYEKKHNEFLRKNGAECTVLLKKDGKFPLKAAGDIALYGNGARNTIKGGTGSGEVNSRFFINIEDGLKNAGFNIKTISWLDSYDRIRKDSTKKFIKQVKREASKKHIPAIVYSMGKIMTEPEYELPLNGEADTCVYVLSRISGEGADREPVRGDILLTETEKKNILECNSKYENFMLVINSGGVVDLSEVSEVKNILVLSQLGVETGDILADILLGKSNPSGKLATTWSKWEDYSKVGEFGNKNDTRYKEGIYVGYRYFDSVQVSAMYPFGFGLSYTEFDFSEEDFSVDEDVVSVTSKITNKGDYPGKEVLEVYVSVPSVKLDQPYQMLSSFSKSEVIKPGDSKVVSAKFSMADLASYDEETAQYILEKGDYIIRVGNSSKNTKVCGVVKVSETIVVMKLKNVLGKPDFTDFKPEPVKFSDDLTGIKSVVFDSNAIKAITPEYNPEYEIDPLIEKLSDEDLILTNIGAFDPEGGIASMVGNAGLSVAGAAGQTYMGKIKEGIPSMVLADGPAGVRISREYALDKDGIAHTLGATIPESMQLFMPGIFSMFIKFTGYKVKKTDVIKNQYATALPIGTAIAQSFNINFAEMCGDIVGYEMAKFGVHLWLAPALNIHRSIQCGRNFEYYSEDPIVSGEFTAAITRGVEAHEGCGVTIKHYAANNQEYNRTQNNSQVSERAMREIYLKGFGIAVKKSFPKAVMTSYNLLNGVHTGEHRGLIEDILRAEFGHKGIVMTDWVVDTFNNDKEMIHPISKAPKTIMAGNDLFMPGGNNDYKDVLNALKEGKVTRKQLEINATRMLNMGRYLVDKK